MKPTEPVLAVMLVAAPMFYLGHAAAADQTPWLVRVGVHNVDPDSDGGTVAGADAEVDSQAAATFNIDYYLTPNIAIDLLGAIPPKHDIELDGEELASVKHLPPTLSLQYHFLPDGPFDPFVGAGVNYTTFYEDKLKGPLAGAALDLDDSWGFAAQIGVDYKLDPAGHWLVGADLRYIDIDADVQVDGVDAGTAHIDPLVYGVTLGYRF